MTILEVAVSGAILAVILLGVANFSTFTAKMNQSNNQSGSFAGVMSTIDNIIKTQDCDTLLGGIPVPTASGASLPFVGFSPVPGFVLESPSPAPLGFAFGTGSDPTSFQLTMIQSQVDTATVGTANWDLDTFDLRIALKKVDSAGHPMAGTPMQMKDYTVNLWVDHSSQKTVVPQYNGAIEYGTCTYKKPVVFSGPVVTPACVTYPGNFSVAWSMPMADTANLWFSPNWGIAPTGPLAPGQMIYTPLPAPSGNFNDLTVVLTVTDPGNNVSPSSTSAPAVSVYQSPTVTATFNPSTVASPTPTLELDVVTNDPGVGGGVSIVSPISYSPLTNGPNLGVPVNITTPGTYNFTVVATNGCGTTAQSIASVIYSTSCTSCMPVPAGCPGIGTYTSACGLACTCPATACTGCPSTSTYCASAPPVPATDTCGNPCGVGTEAGSCPPPTSCIAPSTADSCGNVGACPCTGSGSSPSPSPSPSGPLDACIPSVPILTAVPSVSCPTPHSCLTGCMPALPIPAGDTLGQCCNNPDPCGCAVCSVIPMLSVCPGPSSSPSPSPSPCLPAGYVVSATILVPTCTGLWPSNPSCLCSPGVYSWGSATNCCSPATMSHGYSISSGSEAGCTAQTAIVCGP